MIYWYLDIKLTAMKEYIDELRLMPHPRSLECIQKNAEIWGAKVGLYDVEAFELVRLVK